MFQNQTKAYKQFVFFIILHYNKDGDAMKKRKLKKKVKFLMGGLLIFVILIIVLIKIVNYHNSIEYKLKEIGYSKEEIAEIVTLKSEVVDQILTMEYNSNILTFTKEKYFLLKNLGAYLSYYKQNPKLSTSKIVSLINVKANYEHYDNNIVEPTDTNKENLMLVNKYHYLTESYQPEVQNVSIMYAYDDNQLLESTLNAYIKMWKAASKDNITLIASSSYRTYEEQKKLWESRAAISMKDADDSTARAGFSEHQTGLAIDILTYNTTLSTFEESDAFKWLSSNAYKYGFILRYPKDKEDITGYEYESWHYRYVGVEVATKIFEEDITFDEYYAYYIE